jgi:DNA-binding GntR family transcriptional regulator
LVEPLVAAKAVQKVKKEDIRQLTSIVDSIKNHLSARNPEWDELIAEDTKFHLSLARIAENRIFESVLHTIYDNINRYFDKFLPRDIRILKRIYQDFYNITESIKKRDSHKAHTIILRHIRRFNMMMKEEEK